MDSFLNFLNSRQPHPSTISENGQLYEKASDRYNHLNQTVPTPLGGQYISIAGHPYDNYGDCQKANEMLQWRGY